MVTREMVTRDGRETVTRGTVTRERLVESRTSVLEGSYLSCFFFNLSDS